MPLFGPSASGLEPVAANALLANGLGSRPDEVALASALNSWTWRQLDKASTRLAAHLHAKGIRKSDRVASLMPNRDVLVVHYLACLKAGFVAVPLNYRYMPPEIDYALSLTTPKILLAHCERMDDLSNSTEAANLPLGIITYGTGEGDGSLEALLEKEAPLVEIAPPLPDDHAVIFLTSGSTGKPKGVTHSFNSLGWMIATSASTFALTHDDVMLSASSLSHIGAYLNTLSALSAGAKAVIARTFDPDGVLDLFRSQRPTWLVMLPAALFNVVNHPLARPGDFDSLKNCMGTGDKVADELKVKFAELTGVQIAEGYGMSEVGFISFTTVSEATKSGSVGRAVVGVVLSVRDDAGSEVGNDVEGLLWVQAPGATVGYWDNPKATAETIIEGWLNTGDVMKTDADGDLCFCGRKKQIIVHDGSNISPQEVETSLLAHPRVAGAGVVGVHDLVHGENVWAYVSVREGAEQPKAQDLIAFSRAQLGYKAPEVIVVVDEIPLNATGKVDRVTLKHWAAERHDIEVPH